MAAPQLERFDITEVDGSTSTLVALSITRIDDVEYALLTDDGALADAKDDIAIYVYAVIDGDDGRELADIDDDVEERIFAWFEENVGLEPTALRP